MSIHFYKNLKTTQSFQDLARKEFYTPLPGDWCLAVSDVRDSTNQIKDGRFRDVNLVGATIIAAISNRFQETELPFSFGGDGSVIAFPEKYQKEAVEIIEGCRNLAADRFNLNLAAGIVPVSELYDEGHQILVAKFQTSDLVNQAAFMGDGVLIAEEWVKERSERNPVSGIYDKRVNLSGLECRWNPFQADEIAISMIIDVTVDSIPERFEIYQQVLRRIYDIFDGSPDKPVAKQAMKLTFKLSHLLSETKLRSDTGIFSRIKYFFNLIILQLTGKIFMNRGIQTNKTDWGDYKPDFVKNSDYRKFSQSLKMIVTGNRQMKQDLKDFLEFYYSEGKLIYGLHETKSTVTTCFVKEYQSNHIHFIDGTGGGYTKASIDFKRRLKEFENRVEIAASTSL